MSDRSSSLSDDGTGRRLTPPKIRVPKHHHPLPQDAGVSSPTDGMMSPITAAISKRRDMFKSHGKGTAAAGPTIILGSSSRWRQMVMSEMGYNFSTLNPDIDEKAVRHPNPYMLPTLVARAKADALLKRVNIPALIITADQVVLAPRSDVTCETDAAAAAASGSSASGAPTESPASTDAEGSQRHDPATVEMREKPESLEQARHFIETYSGKWIQTVSAIVVHNTATGARVDGVDLATVHFKDIPADTIDALLRPPADGSAPAPLIMKCAGAVQVEHHLLEPLITHKTAGNDSIFGLPKALLAKLLVSQGAPEPAVEPTLPHGASVAVAIAAHEGLE